MRNRVTGLMAGLAVAVGLVGVSATGCQNLAVGPQLTNPDSTPDPGLDDPDGNPIPGGGSGAGGNIVPLGDAGLSFEEPSR